MRFRAKIYSCLSALAMEKIGNILPEIDLWCFRRNPSILQLLPIGKIAKALQPERDKKLLGGDEGIGSAAPRRPWPGPDQFALMQQIVPGAADLPAKEVLQRSHRPSGKRREASAARRARRPRSKGWGTSSRSNTRSRCYSTAPDKNATSSGVSVRSVVTQGGIRGIVSMSLMRVSRANFMLGPYLGAALDTNKPRSNRPALQCL